MIESLPSATRDYILARSEGNPLFVEEVIRMLIDRGVIRREGEWWVATQEVSDVDIPETIHGLLLARIDRLPPEIRRTLRVASVIGRQFPATVLADVVEYIVSMDAIETQLDALESVGLVETIRPSRSWSISSAMCSFRRPRTPRWCGRSVADCTTSLVRSLSADTSQGSASWRRCSR